ncbi:MAG: DUF4166 domain-containing protein [Ruegeria sp.]
MDSKGDPFLQALGTNVRLPGPVKDLHKNEGQYSGQCSVTRGRGVLVALLLRIGRFPPEGDNLPVTLNIRKAGAYWHWDRDFAGHQTCSRVRYDPIRGCVQEEIGGLTIWLRPVQTDTGLAIEIRRLCLFGIPCPGFLLPRSASTEAEDAQSRFQFDISARFAGIGLLIRYKGWLAYDHKQREPC